MYIQFPIFSSNILQSPAYGVCVSQLIRYGIKDISFTGTGICNYDVISKHDIYI